MIPPHSMDAEKAVLGSVLVRSKSLHEAAEHVGPDDFYAPSHELLFSAMQELDNSGRPVDTLTVKELLRTKGSLDKIGGGEYLDSLTDATPNVLRVASYARIIRDKSRVRRVISVVQHVMNRGYEDPGDCEAFVSWAQSVLIAACSDGTEQTSELLYDVMAAEYADAERRSKSGNKLAGMSTGFVGLDKVLGGLQDGRLTVLAARPGVGKSALAKDIAAGVAMRGTPTLFVSLEMSSSETGRRVVSADAGIENRKLASAAELTADEWSKYAGSVEGMRRCKLWMLTKGADKADKLCSHIRNMHASSGVRFVVIDYLQLITAGYPANQRAQEVQAITRRIKLLSMELNIPVLLLSQLNRESAKREGGRPQMSELRESGAIEQDADTVMLLSREGKQDDGESDPSSSSAREDVDNGPMVIGVDIPKNRGGMRGYVKMQFDPRYTRFGNLETRYVG